jgi:hypothetical protein
VTSSQGDPARIRADPLVQEAYLGANEAPQPALPMDRERQSGGQLLEAEGLHTY